MTSTRTLMKFLADSLSLTQADRIVRVALSPERITREYFRHSPPSPVELEQAIQDVEDTLQPAYATLGTGRLVADSPDLHGLPEFLGLKEASAPLPRDALESAFSRLAALSEGRPLSQDPLPADPLFAATLLILRELMHHLDFTELDCRNP